MRHIKAARQTHALTERLMLLVDQSEQYDLLVAREADANIRTKYLREQMSVLTEIRDTMEKMARVQQEEFSRMKKRATKMTKRDLSYNPKPGPTE